MTCASRLLFVLLCCIILGGCGNYFAPDRNVKRKVTESEIIGTWRMTPDSLTLLKRDGFRSEPAHAYTITLNADGTFRFASVVDGFHGLRYVDVKGTYVLEHDTNGNSNIHKKNVLKIMIRAEGASQDCYLNFAEEDGSLLLWSYYGDPDLWEFIEYERGV